jgi:flagellar biosynthesis/type III secretory pathway M-ring protein FliF/YscJ
VPHSLLGGLVYAVTPTILVGLIFWFAMRAIVRADRTERTAYAAIEAEERAKAEVEERAAAPVGQPAGPSATGPVSGAA